MAQIKYGIVRERHKFAKDSALIGLELEPGEASSVRGGQYLIINTGIELSPGKALKRAYSVLGVDERQNRITIGLKQVTEGIASKYLSELPLGHKLAFSGPWGQFKLSEEKHLTNPKGSTFIFASYTGITAGLGLARDINRLVPEHSVYLHWFRPQHDYFLSDEMVREILQPAPYNNLHIHDCPEATDPNRLSFATEQFQQWILPAAANYFASGDGMLNLEFQNKLKQTYPEASCLVENFFHKPQTS